MDLNSYLAGLYRGIPCPPEVTASYERVGGSLKEYEGQLALILTRSWNHSDLLRPREELRLGIPDPAMLTFGNGGIRGAYIETQVCAVRADSPYRPLPVLTSAEPLYAERSSTIDTLIGEDLDLAGPYRFRPHMNGGCRSFSFPDHIPLRLEMHFGSTAIRDWFANREELALYYEMAKLLGIETRSEPGVGPELERLIRSTLHELVQNLIPRARLHSAISQARVSGYHHCGTRPHRKPDLGSETPDHVGAILASQGSVASLNTHTVKAEQALERLRRLGCSPERLLAQINPEHRPMLEAYLGESATAK